MAEPQTLLPEDFDPEEVADELEPEDVEIEEDRDQEPDAFEEVKEDLKEKAKEKFRQRREQKQQQREQEKLRTDESRKPPKQTEQPAEDPLAEQKQAKAKSEAERAKSGRQKLDKLTKKPGAKPAGGAAKQEAASAGREGARAAGKAAGRAAAQTGRAIGQAAAQAGRSLMVFLFETPWGWVILGVILLIIIIIAIIFIVWALSGDGGKGPAQYPETAHDFAQATTLLTVSSDVNATREKILTDVNRMEERLNGLKNEAVKQYNATKAQAASSEIDAIIEQVNLLKPVAADPAQRLVVIEKINEAIEKFSAKYPELLFAVGRCADLGQYIEGGQFVIARAPERQTIVSGYLRRGGHSSIDRSEATLITANPKLCNVILFILSNGYEIGGVTLTYGHRKYSSGSVVSQHFVGEAIDIAVLNGASAGSDKWVAQSKNLMTLLQKNHRQLGIWEMWGPSNVSVNDCLPTSQTIANHANHIHLGVTNPEKEKRCR